MTYHGAVIYVDMRSTHTRLIKLVNTYKPACGTLLLFY